MSIHPSGPHILACAALLVSLAPAAAPAAELSRSHLTLTSAKSVDLDANTVTLPLRKAIASGKVVWYILTDSSDKADARKRGVNYSPLLGSLDASAVDVVTIGGDEPVFRAAPDFSAARTYVPSSTGFPPASAAPGATGASYSPFVHAAGSTIVWNAPIVATGETGFDLEHHTNTHDRVVAIDTRAKTVTLLLAHGFAAGKPVVYISTEAGDPGAASIERATYTPRLAKVEHGSVPIFVVANGREQGLGISALGGLDKDATVANAPQLRSPLNVLATFPSGAGAAAYSPLWAASIGEWSPAVKTAAGDSVLTSAQSVSAAVDAKRLTGPGGKAFGPVGININCPVVAYVDTAP
ncbi:MAG: hypothetical protein NVSMB64_16930 [Candidatus Velthaea sp.]